MRKLYLFIATLALSVTIAMAQLPAEKPGNNAAAWTSAVHKTKTTASPVVTKGKLSAPQGLANAKMPTGLKSAAKAVGGARSGARALASNQKYMGAYTSDTYLPAAEGLQLYDLLGEGWFTLTAFLPAEQIAKYEGGKITGIRFALANAAVIDDVVVYTQPNDGNDPVRLCWQMFNGDAKEGWNEVTFSNAKTIDLTGTTGLLIGFTYYQTADKNESSAYPISMVPEGNTTPYLYMYGNPSTGSGETWYDLTGYVTELGNLSVQAIVENDNFPQKDPVVQGLVVTQDWWKKGATLSYATALNNFGTSTIGNLELGIDIDNEEVSTMTVNNLTETSQTVNGTVALPSDIAIGGHTITVRVKTADGEVLTDNTADDGMYTYFYVYDNSVPRQKNLVEEIVSQYDSYTPNGNSTMDNFVASRANDDIVRVGIHANMSGETGRDEFVTNYLTDFINILSASSVPSATFNRTVVNGSLTQNTAFTDEISTEDLNAYFNEIVEYTNRVPSFATVNIGGSYDAATRKLDVKVSGEGVDVKTLLADCGLTVLLTEDGITAQQKLLDETMDENYTHNNVLRYALTDALGDDINWNGNTYEQSFSTTLDAGWNADKMNVVAFIAPKFDASNPSYYTEWVTNANSVAVKSSFSTGIKGVYSNGTDAVETARYNAAGQAVSGPVRGLNIIKMSNGETRKVVVK